MNEGNIILLNGTSSSGKTLISKALQEIMDDCYIHTGLDHYLERLPADPKVHRPCSAENPPEPEGWLWLFGEDKCVTEIRIGPMGFRLLKGMYQAFAALASEGNHLIVDDVIFNRQVLREAVYTLSPFNVLFVGVRCPFEVALQRERARPDRTQGLVKAHYELVHAHGIYDLEVDTSRMSPMDCALQIKQRLEDGAPPTAFRQLKRMMETE